MYARPLYASTFLQCFEPAIPHVSRSRTKVAVNASVSDTELLDEVVKDMVQPPGFDLKVAWVEGDNVTNSFKDMVRNDHDFKSLTDGKSLTDWGHDPICPQAYLGSLGISEALRQGADICGR